MIKWIYYPRSTEPTVLARKVVAAFEAVATSISSEDHELASNQVLLTVAAGLAEAGFNVEKGPKAADKICVPVLFGLNGRIQKAFHADAHHKQAGFVVEVEAGRGVVNNQFLKDFFQACMMHEVEYLAIAVRNVYRGREDFELVRRFFDTLYASSRLSLPLRGILLIGY